MLAVSTLVTAHLLATMFMVGLIWFVQVVHYPLFLSISASDFVAYEAQHRFRTGLVVGPPMAIEGVTTLWLFLDPPSGVSRTVPLIGGLLLAVVLLSTIVVQVPLHERLSQGFDESLARRLVRTNWVRTVGWTARAVVAVLLLAR